MIADITGQSVKQSSAGGPEGWRASIPDDVRAKIDDLHKITPWTYLKILVLFAIWFICAAIAIQTDNLWIQVPCWLIIGFALHGMGVFMHEGAHNALFGKWWLDRPIGFLCGLTVFFPCSSYRATHMLHHKFENTDKDPDNLEANFPQEWLRSTIFYSWFLIGMPLYILQVVVLGPFRAQGWIEKLACIIEPLLVIAVAFWLYSVGMSTGSMDILLNGWIWALPFTVLIANFRGLAEHTQLHHDVPPDPLHSTRSLKSNRFISFFFNNQNHHLEHHIYPEVPWDNLSKVHALLLPVYEKHHASIADGYGLWIVDALRYGPNRTMSYKDGRAVWDTP